jgi:hypothetical protein
LEAVGFTILLVREVIPKRAASETIDTLAVQVGKAGEMPSAALQVT